MTTFFYRTSTAVNAFKANLPDVPRVLWAWLLGAGLLGGTSLLFASMTIVNAGNYAFNLVLGRWLGPAAFADLSLIITLFLVMALVTAPLQTSVAKFSATYTVSGQQAQLAGLRRWMLNITWLIGLGSGLVFTLGSPLLRQFFHTQSVWPFVLFGLGVPLYLAQGIDRGILQGQTRFGQLALSYQTEMWVRLIASVSLVALGWSVNGAVAGLTLSLVAAWTVTRRAGASLPPGSHPSAQQRRQVLLFMGPVAVALVGQILINNSDILIVKHFFNAQAAGQYAALALIGRVVFFATYSVVAVMFPVVAQKQQRDQAHRHLLWLSLGVVGAISSAILAATLLMPQALVNILFGSAYLAIAPLLWLYVVATMLYTLANVVINYRLSLGYSGGSALAVVAGLLQVGVLWRWHNSVFQVVLAQILLMGLFLAALLVWDAWLNQKPG